MASPRPFPRVTLAGMSFLEGYETMMTKASDQAARGQKSALQSADLTSGTISIVMCFGLVCLFLMVMAV